MTRCFFFLLIASLFCHDVLCARTRMAAHGVPKFLNSSDDSAPEESNHLSDAEDTEVEGTEEEDGRYPIDDGFFEDARLPSEESPEEDTEVEGTEEEDGRYPIDDGFFEDARLPSEESPEEESGTEESSVAEEEAEWSPADEKEWEEWKTADDFDEEHPTEEVETTQDAQEEATVGEKVMGTIADKFPDITGKVWDGLKHLTGHDAAESNDAEEAETTASEEDVEEMMDSGDGEKADWEENGNEDDFEGYWEEEDKSDVTDEVSSDEMDGETESKSATTGEEDAEMTATTILTGDFPTAEDDTTTAEEIQDTPQPPDTPEPTEARQSTRAPEPEPALDHPRRRYTGTDKRFPEPSPAPTKKAKKTTTAISTRGSMYKLRVLSYNICWGCMEADTADSTGMKYELAKECVKDIGKPGASGDNGMGIPVTRCAENMGKAVQQYTVDQGGYDLMAFQEASNFDNLFFSWAGMEKVEFGAELPFPHAKGIHEGQKKKAWIVSLYNKDLFGPHDRVVTGVEDSDSGRPFLMLIFDARKLIFINLHNCQKGGKTKQGYKKNRSWDHFTEEFDKALWAAWNEKPERRNYRVILAGDFNDRRGYLPGKFRLPWNDVTMQLANPHAKSCCSPRTGRNVGEDDHKPGDYIFDSEGFAENRIPRLYSGDLAQSDHKPVEAILVPKPRESGRRDKKRYYKKHGTGYGTRTEKSTGYGTYQKGKKSN